MPAFLLAIFLSAFLLFQVQPIIARYILPWFGGSPAVWTTCMLCFQVGLLGGYAYAHGLVTFFRKNPKVQIAVHLGLLALSLLMLPITPDESLKPTGDGSPVAGIVWLLASTVALPYLVISASGPLLQHWFSEASGGKSPYRLYAVSNLGSLLGLLSYPFLFEPILGLNTQTWLWSGGYLGYAILAGLCAWLFFQKRDVSALESAAAGNSGSRKTTILDRILWVVLPACGSVLLIATTSQMTQDIAVIPFFWVIPLGLYLVTFIISFDHARWYQRAVWIPLAIVSTGAMILLLLDTWDPEPHIGVQMGIYVAAMFCVVMACHGEMVRIKPDPSRLTGFYLAISLGGALGGAFVNLAAPRIFGGWAISGIQVGPGYWELHVGLIVAAIAILVCIARDLKSAVQPIAFGLAAGGVGLTAWNLSDFYDLDERLEVSFSLVALLVLLTFVLLSLIKDLRHLRRDALAAAVLGVVLNVVMLLLRKDQWHAMIVIVMISLLIVGICIGGRFSRLESLRRALSESGLLLLAASTVVMSFFLWEHIGYSGGAINERRGFYGVLRVEEDYDWETDDVYRTLYNGRIAHGHEYLSGEWAGVPSTYYSRESGAGAYFEIRPTGGELAEPQHIGVIGLGVGTLAAFASENDAVRFYEINPQVEEIARESFFYLENCRGHETVVLGDARTMLERELKQDQIQQFDVLFVDAFTGDSIPIHLLTREAFELYFKHLKPDGVLAMHITNRYLNLQDPVRILAREFDREATLVSNYPDDGYGSDWVLITNDGDFHLELYSYGWASDWDDLEPKEILWTDDYSNLFHVIESWGE